MPVSLSETKKLRDKALKDAESQRVLMDARKLEKDWKAVDIHRSYMNQFTQQAEYYNKIIEKA
jgi:hypothetical protein